MSGGEQKRNHDSKYPKWWVYAILGNFACSSSDHRMALVSNRNCNNYQRVIAVVRISKFQRIFRYSGVAKKMKIDQSFELNTCFVYCTGYWLITLWKKHCIVRLNWNFSLENIFMSNTRPVRMAPHERTPMSPMCISWRMHFHVETNARPWISHNIPIKN